MFKKLIKSFLYKQRRLLAQREFRSEVAFWIQASAKRVNGAEFKLKWALRNYRRLSALARGKHPFKNGLRSK